MINLLPISTFFSKLAEDFYHSSSGHRYWGKQAAGILILCLQDATALLLLRSENVQHPGTWGIAGGAVSEEEETQDGALREAEEELGSLPHFEKLLDTVVYQDGGFSYHTFIYNISLEEKENWTSQISLNWENDDFKWFDLRNLPNGLHFGVVYLEKFLPKIINNRL